MEQFENQGQMPETTVRPKALGILCILSMIWGGLGAVLSLVTPLMKDWYVEMMQSNPNMDEEQFNAAMKGFNAGWAYFLISFVLAAGSFTGALLMYKLKKNGFHIYSFSNLAMLFLPTLMLDMPLNWWAVVFTLGFMGAYALFLKHMR